MFCGLSPGVELSPDSKMLKQLLAEQDSIVVSMGVYEGALPECFFL